MIRVLLFCTALLVGNSVYGQSCSRCRSFDLTLGCVTEADNVEPMYNGYMCAALSGQNVALNCSLGDSDGYTKSYVWYKSSKIGGQSFADSDDSMKITNCTESICNLYDVKWDSDDSDVSAHDSFFYQCIVSVKENDTEIATFYSNSLALDIQSYVPPTTADDDTHTVDIGTAESKLSCAVPATNPDSSVIWYYSANSSINGSKIGSVDNMIVVQDTIISTDAKYGYSNGMLVIMNFMEANVGTYKCAVNYQNRFGTVQQKDTATHTIVSSGVTLSSVSEGLRIVSQVSGPDFLFKDTEETVLHCLGSNLVAGDTAYHYWQKAEEVNGLQIYKNLTGSGWALSNENRTLTLNKDYDLDGSHYRCQIQKGADSILVNGYTQAPIIPKSGYIPTSMSCATSNSSYTASSDDLMTADVESSEVIQVLAGSSYYWKKNNEDITLFSDGYTVSSSSLGFTVASSDQCHYMQQFKYYDQLYSVQQIHTLSVLEESYTTVPTVAMETSGGDTVTVTCTASVEDYPSALEDKVGLSVMFDVSGCIEYAEALVDESANSGTCETSNTRWLKINTLNLCNDCVIRCAAATSCKASVEESITIAAGGESCDGTTGAVTSDSLPSWGIALIVVAVVVGLLGVSAVFFYSYMQKLQDDSDGKIMGAAVLKVNAEDDKMKSKQKKKKKGKEETAPSPLITMPSFTSGFGSFFNAEANPDAEGQKGKKGKAKSPPKDTV